MRAHGPKEGAEALPPALDASLLAELNEGLVCLSGCARHGLAVRNPNGAAALARAFGPERFFVELQRPYERGDERRNATLSELAEALGVSTVATGDVARAPSPPARRCRTCSSRSAAARRSTAAKRSGAETTRRAPARAGRGGRAASRSTAMRSRARASSPTPRVRPDRGPRLPLPRLLRHRRAGDRAAPARLRPRLRRALRRRERPQAPRPAAARRGAGADRRARPRRLLPAPLGGARAGARVRARGAWRLGRPQRAAARPRPRQLGRLDRLLPDRALARRSGARRPVARPFPQPRARLRARHRPRLPARHPREADRRGLRTLRPGALRAGRELLDLPRARRDSRRRQGARPAVRRAGAARPR